MNKFIGIGKWKVKVSPCSLPGRPSTWARFGGWIGARRACASRARCARWTSGSAGGARCPATCDPSVCRAPGRCTLTGPPLNAQRTTAVPRASRKRCSQRPCNWKVSYTVATSWVMVTMEDGNFSLYLKWKDQIRNLIVSNRKLCEQIKLSVLLKYSNIRISKQFPI